MMGVGNNENDDERIKIWIKSELVFTAQQSGLSRLDRLKSHKSSSRIGFESTNHNESEDAMSCGRMDWGWVRGYIQDNNNNNNNNNNDDDDAIVEIEIWDTESALHGQSFSITQKDAKAGTVLANPWEHKDDDDDTNSHMFGNLDDSFLSEDENGGEKEEWRIQNKPPVDLVNLTHLHEPAVVHALRKRYAQDEIYTATGPILLALNPFKYCDNLYSSDMMKAYWEQGELGVTAAADHQKQLPPHVYSMADHTFRSMLQSIQATTSTGSRSSRATTSSSNSSNSNNTAITDQSILVSGESGAGKTVTTKYIMKYLATLSQRSDNTSEQTTTTTTTTTIHTNESEKKNIEQQVLQSNPILESFGNARTIRNDNSSRFGKFIELQFSNTGTLLGASIETYLLEKVRLIHQIEGERNYHVFYEILLGMEEDHYFLGDFTAEDFRITSMSGTYDRRDEVDDLDTYQECKEAMDIMGFSKEEQREIYEITCACLHASNLELIEITADECKLDRDIPHLDAVVSLLGVDVNHLNEALCYFNIVAGKEKHRRSLPKRKAEKGIEALIKATYGSLFNYLVKKINASITVGATNSTSTSTSTARRTHKPSSSKATIGVLDIFGFESFQVNSFEQLCINYCNEALQLQFNMFVLKNEQEEYTREGIRWSFISFPENQDVLDLIDKRGSGIIYVLDDQCKAPGTTDKTFASSLHKKCKHHDRFECDARQIGAGLFGIRHYAGLVEYQTEGFMEKNRDELPREAQDLLMSSSKQFVRHLAEMIGDTNNNTNNKKSSSALRTSRANKNQTVGGQFCSQLQSLRQKIDLTSPHYVRCLKPNSMLVPDNFNPVLIADQLRCNGVIEAIRVSRLGYPQRYTHSMFVSRYRAIAAEQLQVAAKKSKKTIPVTVLVKHVVMKIAESSSEYDN